MKTGRGLQADDAGAHPDEKPDTVRAGAESGRQRSDGAHLCGGSSETEQPERGDELHADNQEDQLSILRLESVPSDTIAS